MLARTQAVVKIGTFRKLPTPALPGSGSRVSASSRSQPHGAPVFMSTFSIAALRQKSSPGGISARRGTYSGTSTLWREGAVMKGDPEQRAAAGEVHRGAWGHRAGGGAKALLSKSTVHKDGRAVQTVGRAVPAGADGAGRNRSRAPSARRRGHQEKIPQASLAESGGAQAPPLCHVIWWNCSSAAFSSRLTCAWLMPISRPPPSGSCL